MFMKLVHHSVPKRESANSDQQTFSTESALFLNYSIKILIYRQLLIVLKFFSDIILTEYIKTLVNQLIKDIHTLKTEK